MPLPKAKNQRAGLHASSLVLAFVALVIGLKQVHDHGSIMLLIHVQDHSQDYFLFPSLFSAGYQKELSDFNILRPATGDSGGRAENILYSPYAYAFLVGGCDPDRPGYRNYIYNLLVAAHLLRKHGSTADLVLFLQMSFFSKSDSISPDETHWLRSMGFRIKYIPRSESDSFHRLQASSVRDECIDFDFISI
jgi:hypothetical protein